MILDERKRKGFSTKNPTKEEAAVVSDERGVVCPVNYRNRLRLMVWFTFCNLLSTSPKRRTRGFLPEDTSPFSALAKPKAKPKRHCFLRSRTLRSARDLLVLIPAQTQAVFGLAETQGVFSRPKHKAFSRSQVVFARLLRAAGF